MVRAIELLKEGRTEELWRRCCGFIDLSLEDFMKIQRRLLLEEIELLKRCNLGHRLMNGAEVHSLEDFRNQVPMTTYVDYCPELLEQREDILPIKPILWVQTSGRSGEYPHKWVPISPRFWQEAGLNFSAIAIFGACKERGDVPFKNHLKLLHAVAQPPYLTGAVARKLEEEFGFEYLPSLQESEGMSFEERAEKGFKMALSEGMTGFFGLAGILVAIGEKFKQGSNGTDFSELLSQPKILFRLAKGLLRSRLAGRPLLPKDLWSLKVISSMGTDCTVYKERIKDLWGRTPLEVYGNSETTVVATQTWDYDGMVFFPNLNFLEFIPEDEHFKWQIDHAYQPKTVLLDEVKTGKNYELVITNFHGGAMVRYRVGDMIKITALRNENLDIDIPQMVFERRADDLIDLGFMRLTERMLWQAIENTKIPYRDWTAHKEIRGMPRLHLYIELGDNYIANEQDIAAAVYDQIKKSDDGLYIYRDLSSLEKLIGFKPVEVTLLPAGTSANYKRRRQAEGADLIHLRIPHINPSEEVLSRLKAEVGDTVKEEVAVSS
ncbi:MAG: GH3 auxin-responsive promoter family protein [Dehalococcoidales bacterium]|nr:GH3 auxin-responsive promoter family protein [Dehalococcoidales bacterium]